MAAYETLFETLKPHLSGMNQARIKFLSKLIIALISSNTISYEYLARKIETKIKLASVYRSIQRFFALFEIGDFTVARLIASLVPIGKNGWILTFDRTNWKFGKTNINFLVLAVAYNGVAIPLFWHLLDKRGNSNWKERIDILNRFIECFGKDVIECFTADREFIGHRWLSYLKKEGIPICIRTKDNIHITDTHGVPKPGKFLFSHLGVGEYSILTQRQTMGLVFDIVGCKLPTGWEFTSDDVEYKSHRLTLCENRIFSDSKMRKQKLAWFGYAMGVCNMDVVFCSNTYGNSFFF